MQSELDMLRKLLQVEDVDKAVEENPRCVTSERGCPVHVGLDSGAAPSCPSGYGSSAEKVVKLALSYSQLMCSRVLFLRFLDSEAVGEVLEEMRRLMPNQDPAVMLLRDPSWLLRVERGAKRLGQSPDEPC